ncbi:MAG TPA: CpsB/CapC family capsule biosynthesis tyrosine phosphatase [Thermomicrobiaceae bacterium]|nr:CpsB/CapC family capsule biosynthesis tyrosine phosphatase [Thermomicrobiaceae bacterium]
MSPALARLVDLHSHLLPGVDDGARDLEESLAMLGVAAEQGTTAICATPHADRVSPAQVREGVARLNEVATAHGLPVTVAPGNEILLSPETPARLQAGQYLTLNDTRYVLVELPLRGPWPGGAELALSALVLAGYRPVLAHVERYPGVQHEPELAARLIDLGVLLQVNADSLQMRSSSARRRTAELLLRRHAIHLLASDSHHADHRPPVLRPGLSYVAEIMGDDYAAWLVENARAVLAGGEITPPEVLPAEPAGGRWSPLGWLRRR